MNEATHQNDPDSHLQAHARNRDEIELTDLLVTLWRRKWVVIIITVLFMAGSVVYALLSQPLYTATATVMPVGNNGQSSALSQYASLASSVGISLPSGSSGAPDQQILAILQSRSLAEELVKDLDLVPLIVKDPKSGQIADLFQTAVETLRKDDLSVSENSQTGVISIAVTFPKKRKAELIANHAVSVLEKILNKQNAVLSAQSTKSLEDQITEQGKKVHNLQDQLAKFQRDTKLISPQGQVSSAASLYASLLQQKLSLEVALSRLQNVLSPDNPQVTAAKAQLNAVNQQIGKLEGTIGVGSFSMSNAPAQMVKYQNISGELDVASKIYAGLLAAYQNQKLQQAQNQVFVQVVDPAIVPEKPSKPKKKMIVVLGSIIGLIVSIAAAFVLAGIPQLSDRIQSRLIE